MKKSLSLLAVVLAIFATIGEVAAESPLGVSSNVCASGWLNLRVGTLVARNTERVTYSPQWGVAAECALTSSGTPSLHTDEGEVEWIPPGEGCHVLTHTAGDVTYTARFVVLGDDVV